MKSVLLDTFLRKDPLRGLTVVEVEGPDLQPLLRLYFRSLQFLAAASSQLCKGDSERKNEFKRATSASKVPGRPREGLRVETRCRAAIVKSLYGSRVFCSLVGAQPQGSGPRQTLEPRSDPDHTDAENYFLGAQRRAAAAVFLLISFFGAGATSRDDAQRV